MRSKSPLQYYQLHIISIHAKCYDQAPADADDAEPQAVVPTLVGSPINPDIPVLGCKSYFVGDEAMRIRGNLKLTRPIRDGIVNDWDAFEEVWYCV